MELPAQLRVFKVLKVGVFLNQVMGRSHEDLEAISRRQWREMPGRAWD